MARKKTGLPLGVAGLIAGIVVAAVIAAPGTLSYFVSSKQTQAATVSTGQASLALAGTGSTGAPVYPGGPAQLLATRTLTNTSDVSLSLGAAFTATGGLGSSVTVTIAVQSATTCAATPPTTWPTDSAHWQGVGGVLSSAVSVTLAPTAARTVCVWQSLDANVANGTQGQTAAVSVTLTGTQVAAS